MKKTALKKLLPPFLIAVAVGLAYFAYIYFIGIPRTQARHYYNQAGIEFSQGNLRGGLALLEKGYATWPEGYIREDLEKWRVLVD